MISWADPTAERPATSFADYVAARSRASPRRRRAGERRDRSQRRRPLPRRDAARVGPRLSRGERRRADRERAPFSRRCWTSRSRANSGPDRRGDALPARRSRRRWPGCSRARSTCAVQRENDLIWSFVVNNYLLGKDPFPFDLLHWNRDSPQVRRDPQLLPGTSISGTSWSSRRHDDRRPAARSAQGEHPQLLSCRRGKTTSRPGSRPTGPPALGGASGSRWPRPAISPACQPSGRQRYCYWTNPDTPENPEQWRAGAKPVEGSWWRDWDAWIKQAVGRGLGAGARARRPQAGAALRRAGNLRQRRELGPLPALPAARG